jgi:hypothetical protein
MLPFLGAVFDLARTSMSVALMVVLAALMATATIARFVAARVRTATPRARRLLRAFAMAPALVAAGVALAGPAQSLLTSTTPTTVQRPSTPTTVASVTTIARPRVVAAVAPKPLRVLVIGDSTAANLGTSLRRMQGSGKPPLVFKNVGVPGCQLANAYAQSMVVHPSLWSVQPDSCHHWAQRLAAQRSFAPNIILAVFGPTEMADLQLAPHSPTTDITRADVKLMTVGEAAAIRSEFPHTLFVWATTPQTFAGSTTIPPRNWVINSAARTAVWNQMVNQLARQEHGAVLDMQGYVDSAPDGWLNRSWRPDGTHLAGVALTNSARWTIGQLDRFAVAAHLS